MTKVLGFAILSVVIAQLLFISVVAQAADATGSASVRIDGKSFTYRLQIKGVGDK